MKSKKITAILSAAAMLSTLLVPLQVSHAEGTTLTVGKDKQYQTIRDAVAKAKELNPTSEDSRVTINVDPGNYEEQVVFDGEKYITLQKTPGAEGDVVVAYCYCTGYCAGDVDLNGDYNPKINWSDSRTWTGYGKSENEEQFTPYKVGACLTCTGDGSTKIETISYYDTDGVAHKDVPVKTAHLGSATALSKMATLLVRGTSEYITVKDMKFVNAVPSMVTNREKVIGVAPEHCREYGIAKSYELSRRDALSPCNYFTTEEERPNEDIFNSNGAIDKAKYKAVNDKYAAEGNTFTPGESLFIVKSSIGNERGHAVAYTDKADKITFDGITLVGNQDSLYAAGRRAYFKNCDLIGGTDYIYGGGTAVFDHCKLGLAGFSDQQYGSPIATGGHQASRKYGYLFKECTLYNTRTNNGTNNLGGPWQANSQITYFNCIIDDNGTVGKSNFVLDPIGYHRFGAENGLSKSYEYGTKNISGTAVDFSKRTVNKSVEEGGTGMGTVLDEWQILEFNPRNYFAQSCDAAFTDSWDPMNFGETYLNAVDAAIANATITIPENEETTFDLPSAPEGIDFKWQSASTNAVVSADGTKLTVLRPAAGEANIDTKVTLYAMDEETKFGDKKEISLSITPTTNTTDVFNMPVTVTTTGSLAVDNNYNITISKNGAVVKSDTVTVKANETTATKTIENIPANAEGIEYDVKVVSKNSDITITSPINGATTVTGITGKDVPLNITGVNQIDYTVTPNIAYSSTAGNKTYDLIALAKAAGATDDIDTSEMIKVTYTLNVTPGTSGNSFIDLLAGTPGSSLNANGTQVPSRFVLAKLGHWNQLDMIDCGSTGYGGSKNTANQWLNAGGNFKKSPIQTIEVTIDYKNKVVSAKGDNGKYTFDAFPTDYTNGKLNMAIYKGTETFSISDVKVTYKEIVSSDDPLPTAVPSETEAPTTVPSATEVPTTAPSETESPTTAPSETESPTTAPSETESPTTAPSETESPTTAPSATEVPTSAPSGTSVPTTAPSETSAPTTAPSGTSVPTTAPSETVAPTTAPSETSAPTSTPSTEKMIISAEKSNGNTVVKLANITDGILIGAKYNNGVLSAMKTTEIKGEAVTLEDFEADKVFVWNSLEEMVPLCPSKKVSETSATASPTTAPSGTEAPTTAPSETVAPTTAPTTVPTSVPTLSPTAPASTAKPMADAVAVDFTTMSAVPVYTAESGQGFVTKSSAIMPSGSERIVAPTNNITVSSEGAKVTESDGSYLHNKTNSNDGDDYNYGGLIYRIDTGAPGAYHLEVETTGTSADTRVAPTGMDASRLTGTSNWDNANMVPRTVSATWSEGTWSYDFATGEDFIEIEIEPSSLPSASAPKTVGVKKITVTPLAVNEESDKPTIHIIGDSTQKTYTFNETISAWGQTLVNYFDKSKVNVINYSMGGRAMKSNYNEGRFDEILIRGKKGDFVFIHSAHNDETTSTNRFSRGAGSIEDDLAANNESYNKWLDMYVEAIKARGMTPVLVTAMPRTGSGRYTESKLKPNGFNPDSPGNMREKATSDDEVGLVELYAGAKAYIDKLDAKEVMYIYNTVEAGETPANNAANGANGDGTHYREAASKQWNRIMLQSIYDQSVASKDTYTDKDIMQKLVSYMPKAVQNAAKTGDWSTVFPEMASDVSAVDVVPDSVKQAETNYYYRNNIEKALQLGLLHKDSLNMFKPTQTITVGEFARGMEKAFGLDANSLTSYTKTYAELMAEQTSQASFVEDDTEVFETASDDTADDDTVSLMGDTYTVTVQQPTGGTVTVYNESAFHTATVDVPAGVKANAKIGDNDYFTLTAPSEIVNKADSSGVFAENNAVTTNYVEFRNSNPEKKVIYTAKADGEITVYARFNDNKSIELADKASGEAQTKYINDAETKGSGATVYGIIHFNVEAGKTYELYACGGTGRLFGVKYESTDYPQSTESLDVNANDKIKVVATPDENHLHKAILVNDAEAAETKEHTFTVTGDTTVSAIFTSEPALVEVTKVATDAALTREVMGAILYDAYKLADHTNMDKYMAQNGGVPSPDDPNYDPNIKYEGSPYIPLTGWGALTDKSGLSDDLYAKVKKAYNLGLIRPETGISRGSIGVGTELEPKAEVTRAKAAKTLVFAFILTQPLNGENQLIPNGYQPAAAADIAEPNPAAPSEVVK